MKPYVIDFEKLSGGLLNGQFIEIQGAMNVRPEPSPLQGVAESTIHISVNEAGALTALLVKLMTRATAGGWNPPKP